jgi:hypothetical protein
MLEHRIVIETVWYKRWNLSLFESGFFDEFGYKLHKCINSPGCGYRT